MGERKVVVVDYSDYLCMRGNFQIGFLNSSSNRIVIILFFVAEMARDSTLGHQSRVVVMSSGGAGAGVEVGGGIGMDSVPLPSAVATAESQEILEVSFRGNRFD